MALLERVSTLIRANLTDLIEKAEDPQKTIKQVILDMENQLIQVKTQVAVAMADQHLLEKKRKEMEQKAAEWMQKAEYAVEKDNDELAKAALGRSVNHRKMAEAFKQQEADQKTQAELLKTSLKTLGEKLVEANAKRDLLMAQHRRERGLSRVGDAQIAFEQHSRKVSSDRIQVEAETLIGDEVEEKFASMEQEDQIGRLLAELKSRRRLKS